MKKINFKYLKLWKEIPFFLMLIIYDWLRKSHSLKGNGKILIVNSCLMGEFVSSLPSISYFIKENPGKIIDLAVSSPLKPMAQKMAGVRNVFTVSSSYGEASEIIRNDDKHFDAYEKIIVLRAGPDVYRVIKAVETEKIQTSLLPFVGYALHLVKSLVLRRYPKRWGEVNFEMLGYEPKKVPFDKIFSFKKEDYSKITELLAIHTEKMKVIIHTGSHWPMNHWNSKNWVELLKKIHQNYKCSFIFIGGIKEDADDYTYISSHLDFEIFSLIGKIDILKCLLLLRLSDYFIGIDSGPMNMAHLADLRSINIFGPGPHMFMPESSEDIILDKSFGRGLYQRYYKAKNSFISKITPDEVYEAFETLVCKKISAPLPIRK